MATTQRPAAGPMGAAIRRREDPRFLTGRGQYTDDIVLPAQTYAAFVRSPYAHARILGVDADRARAMPGVVAVYTGDDLQRAGVNPIPTAWLLPDIRLGKHYPLAVGKVRHQGEAVAVVIAESAAAAKDAAEAVEVAFDPLPAVVDTEHALDAGGEPVHAEAPDNRCFHWSLGDAERTDAAFRRAHTVVRQRLVNQRLAAMAMEPRASNASYHPATGELTLYVTSQNPHVHRLIIGAFVLGIPEHKLRVIAPDVGGGFGSKIFIYPEEVVAAWASRQLARPVKWTAERRESFLTDAQGRDHVTDAEMALDAEGRVLGLRVRTTANLGAYVSLFGPVVPTYLYGTLLSGQYDIPAIHCTVDGVYTTTTPVDAYRGAGRPEACYVVERMMDLGARAMGLDPAEIRRRNFIAADRFPYQTQVALVYDSGNYAPNMQKALDRLGYQTLRHEQARLRGEGRFVGIGISSYIEACGLAPSHIVGQLGAQAGLWESALVRVHPTGKVTVFTGSHSHGQGHETTFAQVVATQLGVAYDDVEVVHGDTQQVPFGMGTYGSRSAAVGGAALVQAAQKLVEKGRRIAAHQLEAAVDDIEFADGRYAVKGAPDRARSIQDVALAAYLAHDLPQGMEPGFEASQFFNPENFVYPFGTHVAVVEVDADTGVVRLMRYVAVDDVGNVINPMIVDGMIHGGVAQGVAQALWEQVSYDEDGQLLTGSLLDYAVPRADQLPSIETDRTVTPSPVNPLGVKGVGEAGTIAATAAVANAVMDALMPLGITHIDLPLTPARVWQAIRTANRR